MKLLTKEEEQQHYNATVQGGIIGGTIGLGIGAAAVYAASARFHTFNSLTLPMKAFLTTSSGTFAAIIAADRASRSYEWKRDPQRQYRDKATKDLEQLRAQETTWTKVKQWGSDNRYPIVGASWVASMGIALAIVGRSPYLTKAQKLVQARVYAQGLTVAVMVATAVLETSDASKGKGRWETVKILDPNDPEHKHIIEKKIHHELYAGEDLWRDMVATEERKINERKHAVEEQETEDKEKNSSSSKKDKTEKAEKTKKTDKKEGDSKN